MHWATSSLLKVQLQWAVLGIPHRLERVHASGVQTGRMHKGGRIAIEAEQLWLDEVTGRPGVDLLGWLPM